MRYLPKSPAERQQMLADIGAASIDSLFEVIPEEYRLTRDLDVPRVRVARQQLPDRGVGIGADERDRLAHAPIRLCQGREAK